MPKFIQNLVQTNKRELIGQFHLHSEYQIEPYLGLAEVIQCVDVMGIFNDPEKEQEFGKRILIMTDTAFLVLQPNEFETAGLLRGWQCLYYL